MDDVFKYVAVGLIGMIMAVVVREIKPEYSVFIIIATGAIILLSLSDKIVYVINTFSNLSDKSNIPSSVFLSIVRIIGIGYITEYASSICDDYQCSSIGKKIQLAGKIIIFIMALPIILGIIDIVGGLME